MKMLWGSLFTSLLLFSSLYAQISSVPFQEKRAAQYFLGGEDQVLMAVNVWGFVRQPGQYMVPYDTDLVSLLSFAGGPMEDAKITSIRVVRASTLEDEEGQVIQVDVKDYLQNGRSDLIPVLRPGDTIVVSGTTFYFVKKFFDFAWRVAAIAQAYAIMDRYLRRD